MSEADLTPLTAVSPVDGRYRRATAPLADFFSEAALIRYRVRVEVEYFIALCELPLPPLAEAANARFSDLRAIYRDFDRADAQRVKEIERTTNHDVKAVEYFLKEAFDQRGWSSVKEFIHFGLTSQDINNTALPLAMREAWEGHIRPALIQVTAALRDRTREWREIPMLARTHGQPASPTRLGKEIAVFVERLDRALERVDAVPFAAKFGGATGNFNAHHAAFPEVDWPAFADRLINEGLGLRRSRVTTQIEHYDHMAAFFDGLKRLHTILIDLCRDFWTYISLDYFKQEIKKGEIGSSAMPHKVNPIDFENAEGNLGLANALLEHLSATLPISRLQRDLTDSTVSRNVGVPLAHGLIAYRSILRGLGKLRLHRDRLAADLAANWAVVAEGIQTILRREGVAKPYEALLELTRTHDQIDQAAIAAFIDGLSVADSVKAELRRLTPETYTGVHVESA
jgi:adenylosuccinate lyase